MSRFSLPMYCTHLAPGVPPVETLPVSRSASAISFNLAPAFLLAAGDWFEIVAALIFFLVTGIAQWLQKRSRERRGLAPEVEPESDGSPWDDSTPTPPPLVTERRPAHREMDLEEQLRRLLNPGLPPEPPPLPPPLPTPQSRYRADDTEPDIETWERESEGSSRPVPALDRADSAYQRGADLEALVAARLSSAGSFTATSAAFQQASGISESVAARLRDVLGRASGSTPSTAHLLGTRFSPTALSLAATLRHPATARQAVLASIVLQPPKALEDPYSAR